VPGIRAVERFVAKREVGDDVVFYYGFQQRPLEPGRITKVASDYLASGVNCNPGKNVPSEPFDKSEPFPHSSAFRKRGMDRSRRKLVEAVFNQGQALPDLLDPDPDTRIDVTVTPRGNRERHFVIRGIGEVTSDVETTPRRSADETAGSKSTGKRRVEPACPHRSVEKRGSVVIQINKTGEMTRNHPKQLGDRCLAVLT
jgi:hypothetical protein